MSQGSGADLEGWLLTAGRRCGDVPDLLAGLMPQLRAELGVDRLWVGTNVLHPQAAAYAWVWEHGREVRRLAFTREQMAALQHVDTPMRRLQRGDKVRFRRGQGVDVADVGALWPNGYTDFFAESLWLRGQWGGGFTFATKRPGGFAEGDVVRLQGLVPLLSAVVEPLTMDAMYGTLLQTYLGSHAGRRVAGGQVRRGDGQVVEAAIWFCDVRGFTTLSHSVSQEVLLALLDDVFLEVVTAVRRHGGEVLKFIGDGALAIFSPEVCGGRQGACAAATAAADDLQRALVTLRAGRERADAPAPHAGVGLHYGQLMYGNIGAPTRLDFTAIGASVNLAARVEGQCAALGHAVLATEAVAGQRAGWAPVGSCQLKGVPEPVVLYGRQSPTAAR